MRRCPARAKTGLRVSGPAAVTVAIAVAIAGCGGGDVPSLESGANAVCRQAAAAIQDQTARQVADEACRSRGDVGNASRAAKKAARERCLQQSTKVVDPIARRQIRALCPPAS